MEYVSKQKMVHIFDLANSTPYVCIKEVITQVRMMCIVRLITALFMVTQRKPKYPLTEHCDTGKLIDIMICRSIFINMGKCLQHIGGEEN